MNKIGITERGDAGLDLSWKDKLDTVAGAILISKNFTDEFINEVFKAKVPLILHCTCTGYGGTEVEPNVPECKKQLNQMIKLITAGFPVQNIVLRIDPIFPTLKGIRKFHDVMNLYIKYIRPLGVKRIRISVLDEYNHVKERFKQHGWPLLYEGKECQDMSTVAAALECYNMDFEACAEPELVNLSKNVKMTGCISAKDLRLMGLPLEGNTVNPQNRKGCKCLSCKTELLSNRRQCPHGCVYCYWR